MADTIRPMLPPLHEAHRVPPLAKAGTWHAMGTADPLLVIARGLDTGPRLAAAAADIVSVPDVWAQLTVFDNALATDRHPLHARAVAEWRGLLGCFALAAYRVPDLTSELLALHAGPGSSRWGALAARLTPQCALLGGGRIAEVALVRVGTTLIALGQPLTLLAPSRSLGDLRGRPPVPWMDHGRFLDPLLAADLSRDERAVLARFLARLCADLEPERDAGRDVQALLGLARGYLADAGQGASRSGTQFESEPASMALPGLRVFTALRTRERAVGAHGRETPSDCLLALRPDLPASPLKGVILFDPSLHEQLGRAAGEVTVWGRHSLRMLQDRPESLQQLRAEAQSAGYLVVESGELFLPRLYRTDGVEGEAAFEQHPQGARGHLLPLSPLLLAILPRARLARACRMSPRGGSNGGGGMTVDLQLSLADGASVTLSKTYASEEGGEPPFALSVWPDFRADWWRLQLAYSGATPDIQFVASGFVSPQGLAKALAANDGFGAVAAARALLAGDVAALADTTWFRQDQQGAKALHMLPGAAEAVVMEDRRAAACVAGLLLLPEPRQASAGAAGGTARVGIDFGTTNTAIYLQVGAQEPQPLRINPRHILAYRPAAQSQDELDAELLPVSLIEVPFQTILRDRRLPDRRGERMAFRDTLVYFAQRRVAALGRLTGRSSDDDLYANLKWGDDQPSRERVELFLTEVAVLALAEAAALGIRPGDVVFCCSFPEAFRQQQLASFQGAARNAVARALRMVGGAGLQAEPEFQTESVATAQYFINRLKTPPTEGLVTFDIGGQTTDVAVVQSGSRDTERLAWRGSFQLAGRHLLIDHLRDNPAIIGQLARGRHDLEELQSALASVGQASAEKRTLGTELLVNSQAFMEAFDTVLPTLAGMADADRLRAVALTGLAGLFDYVGRTVRRLAEDGRIKARAGTPMSVCLGGRASLLYRTLLRAPDEQAAALRFFTAAAGEAMPLARLVFSQAPKQEVAFGLVSDDKTLTGRVPSEPLLGEALRCGGTDAPASALVSGLDIDQEWRIEEPLEFRRFVDRLPELRIRPVLPAAILGELAGLANAEMGRALRRARQERGPGDGAADTSAIEPPFIVLLRLLVHRLATDPGAVRP